MCGVLMRWKPIIQTAARGAYCRRSLGFLVADRGGVGVIMRGFLGTEKPSLRVCQKGDGI
jgi:hypothetical protein